MSKPKVTIREAVGQANAALAQAMVEKRRSGAAGTHADRRTKRNRTRAARRATALKGW